MKIKKDGELKFGFALEKIVKIKKLPNRKSAAGWYDIVMFCVSIFIYGYLLRFQSYRNPALCLVILQNFE